MPLQVPAVENRSYEQLLQEALARIPVHTPEWTNYNLSDPGVTLVELWAFLTENSLYLSRKMPERNRLKFLSLLRLSLSAGSASQGIVVFNNSRGPLRTVTLNDQLEVRANDVPFRTVLGLDVLPIEMQAFYKYQLTNQPPGVREYYRQLYSSYTGTNTVPSALDQFLLYETRRFDSKSGQGIHLATDTVDKSLWVALLMRAGDVPRGNADVVRAQLDAVRGEIANRTLSLGIVPWFETPYEAHASPGIGGASSGKPLLYFEMPMGGQLPQDRHPNYRPLEASPLVNVLDEPGIVQIQLPDKDQLSTWDNLEPLEPGAGDFPPDLEDTTLTNRLITWLRIKVVAGVEARLLWLGLNATPITQRSHVGDLLPKGTGEPDQTLFLSHRPVIPKSLKLQVTTTDGTTEWTQIDDILAASPEIPSPDPRQAPGVPPFKGITATAYTLDPEAGEIYFGDGTRGMRPPFGADIRADYDYSVGKRGNVGVGAVNSSPALPSGFEVKNEIPTWGGADPQSVRDGEKMITRYLQHRDRLVTAGDFEVIARSTPGVEIGRVEVIPAASPQMGAMPGQAPGAVTLMVIPSTDAAHPYAPVPDQMFLDEVCRYLDPRRLITTEVFLRGPEYKDITVSIGINVAPGMSIAQVREAVKQAVRQYLSPLPVEEGDLLDGNTPIYTPPQVNATARGWPLNKAVHSEELRAATSRASGVLSINDLLLIYNGVTTDMVDIAGLQLPRLSAIYVETGSAQAVSPDIGQSLAEIETAGGPIAIPVLPEECE